MITGPRLSILVGWDGNAEIAFTPNASTCAPSAKKLAQAQTLKQFEKAFNPFLDILEEILDPILGEGLTTKVEYYRLKNASHLRVTLPVMKVPTQIGHKLPQVIDGVPLIYHRIDTLQTADNMPPRPKWYGYLGAMTLGHKLNS